MPIRLATFKRMIATCSCLFVSFLAGALQTEATTNSDCGFGMCTNHQFFQNSSYAPALLDAGAKICRVDVAFCDVRSKPTMDPDKWDWSRFEQLRRIKSTYQSLDYLIILGYGTRWAADSRFLNGSGADSGLGPRGINEPAISPGNLYGNYVFEAVKRYKNVVHYWESWNEPDLPSHDFFRGNGHDFFLYQKSCYLAAKRADPGCVVVFAGMCFSNVEGYLKSHGLRAPTLDPPATSFFEDYLKECVKDPNAKANNYYFDVMNQHTYSRATDLFDYVSVDRALMQQYIGEQKPVWITECGFPDTGGTWGGSPDDYCDYLLQSWAWAQLSGVQEIFHFQLDNSNGHGLYSGMLGAPKPAFKTYRDVLVKELSGARLVSQLHGNRGVGFLKNNSPYQPSWQTGYDLFQYDRHGTRILMCFADSSKDAYVQIPAKKSRATAIDHFGTRTQIQAVDGQYKIHLPGSKNFAGWPVEKSNPRAGAMGQPEHLVGGSTVLIVEN